MKINHKHYQLRMFLEEMLTFALIFFVLGMIINISFQKLVFHNIDQNLEFQRVNIMEGSLNSDYQNNATHYLEDQKNEMIKPKLIIFNREGKIVNLHNFNHRDNCAKSARLNLKQINRIHNVKINHNHFRALLVVDPFSDTKTGTQYTLILDNINEEIDTLNYLRTDLFKVLFIAWMLSIVAAYFLSKLNVSVVFKSLKKQREFNSNAAHELRTPLSIIQNELEYLLTKPNFKIIQQSEPISTSLKETQHLQVLIKRLLTLSRSDSGLIQVKRVPIQMYKWFDKVIQPYSEIIKLQNKKLNVNIQINKYSIGNFDPDLIQQLLTILLNNSVKYSDHDHGVIDYNIKQLHHKLMIRISNNGSNIPDDQKQQIFERFYRTDKSRNSKTGGNGLGLSIAKWIILEHHGTIKVSNKDPHGAVFTIIIPTIK